MAEFRPLTKQWDGRAVPIRFAIRLVWFFTVPQKALDNLYRPVALPKYMLRARPGRQSRDRSTAVLIADDEPAILFAMAEFLRACGYTVLTAQSGEGALKAFSEAQQTIQLVISDVVMPGMHGPQLVSAIKRLSPSTATLLMSGTWSGATEGVVALIQKPFTRQRLVATVRDVLAECDFAKIEREQSITRLQRLEGETRCERTKAKNSVATE